MQRHWSYWFQLWWYQYLFQKRVSNDVSWFTVLKCRAQGHPCGVVWYSASGYEPDYSCKVCGDEC